MTDAVWRAPSLAGFWTRQRGKLRWSCSVTITAILSFTTLALYYCYHSTACLHCISLLILAYRLPRLSFVTSPCPSCHAVGARSYQSGLPYPAASAFLSPNRHLSHDSLRASVSPDSVSA
ncbi:hypothetical protein BJX70DRAFT_7698 [Aspergillus crustosus]